MPTKLKPYLTLDTYLYPPRPEHKITAANLNTYDNGQYVAHPKYNGSAAVVFMNEAGRLRVMNRHNQELTLVDKNQIDFLSAYRGTGNMVICGEVLNKNQKGENGISFNQRFIIWEILVFNSMYLVGETTQARLEILEELYGSNRMEVSAGGVLSYDHVCTTPGKGIYKAPAYTKYFNSLYNDIVGTDLYEGLILKRLSAKLNFGYQSSNNTDWQLKCRKPTKNYTF